MSSTEFFESIKAGETATIERLLVLNPDFVHAKGEWGWTALYWAVETGNVRVVELLLAKGARIGDRNDDGETPMFLVADNIPSHPEVMLLLLRAGADINAKNSQGWTPLHKSAFYGDNSALQFLIDHGATVNITDNNGWTALHYAAESGQENTVNLLIDGGASVNCSTPDGFTPLHFAVYANIMQHQLKCHLATIETLLRCGANITAETADSKTPLALAKTQGYAEIAALLVHYGAR